MSAAGAPAAHRRLEPWLALCLCLPPALFTWPGASAPLAGDPFPHLAGSAWIALLALPALALAAAARALRPSAALLLLLVATAAGALSAALLPATDTAELRRAGVHAGAMIALFAAGSALGERGRTWLAGASVVLCLGFTAGAFFTSSGRLAGALANTGALSQAALPGAVAGALLALAPRVPRGARAIGAAAFAGFALHAARAPVLAGILAAGGALTAAGMLASAMLSRRARAACLGAALFLPLGFLALRVAPAAREGRGAERFAADVDGGGVRAAVWRSGLALLGDHLVLGVGPGQVQATFPPYRDAEEIRRSSRGSCLDHATEVDHLHCDALEGLVELGLLGGLAWLAFLALGVRNAVGALRGGEPARALLGASALGLCANALVHSPLVFHPASAALGAALLGSLTPLGARARPSAGLLLFPALAASFLGLPLITHGRALAAALAARASAAATAEGGRAITPEVAAGVRVHLERALGALGDSTPALLRRAEWARTEGEPALPFYEQVLARRPYDLEALQQSALLALVEQRDVERARAAWQAVLRLDPAHPRVLRNLIELELDFGTPAAALAHAQALRSSGCLEAPWVDATAARLLLAGRSEPGLAMLAFHDERFAVRSGQALLALSKELQSTPRAELASALNSAAHHAWALEHIAQENPKNAVRSYRQAMRPTYAHHPGGAPRLCVELAAALALAGDAPAAESELAALGDQAAEHVSAAPDWARNALAELLQRSR